MLGPFTTASRLTPIQQMSLAVLSRAVCASMSTTTPTTTRDRADRYGPMEWAQLLHLRCGGGVKLCQCGILAYIHQVQRHGHKLTAQQSATQLAHSNIAAAAAAALPGADTSRDQTSRACLFYLPSALFT